jgi:riboflavin kinase
MLLSKVQSIDINLTDLSFANQCFEVYGINRGVYNTIDFYFYEKGIKEIKQRRNLILSFFESVSDKNSKRKNFGKGGLSAALDSYYRGANIHKEELTKCLV